MDDNHEEPPRADTSAPSTLTQDLALPGWVATRPDQRALTRDLLDLRTDHLQDHRAVAEDHRGARV